MVDEWVDLKGMKYEGQGQRIKLSKLVNAILRGVLRTVLILARGEMRPLTDPREEEKRRRELTDEQRKA